MLTWRGVCRHTTASLYGYAYVCIYCNQEAAHAWTFYLGLECMPEGQLTAGLDCRYMGIARRWSGTPLML